MHTLLLGGSALAALVVYLTYTYIIHPAFLSPLSQIPNAHPTSSVTSTWIWWARRNGHETRSIHAAHQQRGPIVRLGPNELSVASMDGLRQIYTGGFEKDPWYVDVFQNYGTPNLVSMLERRPHAAQKRMISHVYSKSYVQNSADLQTAASVVVGERLLPALSAVAARDEPIDVLELAQGAGMDFMSAYLFGIANSTDFVHDAEARRHYFRLFRTKTQQLPGVELACEELESVCLSMCQAAENQIQNGSEKALAATTVSTNPVVYSRLASQISPPQRRISEREMISVASEMLDHLLAGHETSGITLTYLLHALSKRPALQASLRAELLTLAPSLTVPLQTRIDKEQTIPVLPSPQDIDDLPLLNAILYETLRLYTATPAPQPRITPPGGVSIEGYSNIPAGVRISTSAYCLHQNPNVFPDPMSFKPERWLQGGKNSFGGTEEMKRWFWAFGSGGRMCIGSNFAIQILKLVVASVYTNFTTTIFDDEGIEQVDAYLAGPVGNKLILKFHAVA